MPPKKRARSETRDEPAPKRACVGEPTRSVTGRFIFSQLQSSNGFTFGGGAPQSKISPVSRAISAPEPVVHTPPEVYDNQSVVTGLGHEVTIHILHTYFLIYAAAASGAAASDPNRLKSIFRIPLNSHAGSEMLHCLMAGTVPPAFVAEYSRTVQYAPPKLAFTMNVRIVDRRCGAMRPRETLVSSVWSIGGQLRTADFACRRVETGGSRQGTCTRPTPDNLNTYFALTASLLAPQPHLREQQPRKRLRDSAFPQHHAMDGAISAYIDKVRAADVVPWAPAASRLAGARRYRAANAVLGRYRDAFHHGGPAVLSGLGPTRSVDATPPSELSSDPAQHFVRTLVQSFFDGVLSTHGPARGRVCDAEWLQPLPPGVPADIARLHSLDAQLARCLSPVGRGGVAHAKPLAAVPRPPALPRGPLVADAGLVQMQIALKPSSVDAPDVADVYRGLAYGAQSEGPLGYGPLGHLAMLALRERERGTRLVPADAHRLFSLVGPEPLTAQMLTGSALLYLMDARHRAAERRPRGSAVEGGRSAFAPQPPVVRMQVTYTNGVKTTTIVESSRAAILACSHLLTNQLHMAVVLSDVFHPPPPPQPAPAAAPQPQGPPPTAQAPFGAAAPPPGPTAPLGMAPGGAVGPAPGMIGTVPIPQSGIAQAPPGAQHRGPPLAAQLAPHGGHPQGALGQAQQLGAPVHGVGVVGGVPTSYNPGIAGAAGPFQPARRAAPDAPQQGATVAASAVAAAAAARAGAAAGMMQQTGARVVLPNAPPPGGVPLPPGAPRGHPMGLPVVPVGAAGGRGAGMGGGAYAPGVPQGGVVGGVGAPPGVYPSLGGAGGQRM